MGSMPIVEGGLQSLHEILCLSQRQPHREVGSHSFPLGYLQKCAAEQDPVCTSPQGYLQHLQRVRQIQQYVTENSACR